MAMERTHRVPLTPRGWTVVTVVIIAFVLGLLFGARSLNAVVAPAVVAVVLAVWRVNSIDRPSVTRRLPAEGTVGETIDVDIAFDTDLDRLGRVEDRVEPPLAATGNEADLDLTRGLSYRIELRQRGRHDIGPMTVIVRDVFGLAERQFEYRDFSQLLVLPRIYPLRGEGLERLATLAGVRLRRERHEFDRLREYRPEDSLRDIHWKTSAKRQDVDFIVKEFISDVDRGALVLSGEATAAGADTLADVLASLATALVRAGVHVGVETPSGRIDPIDGPQGLGDIYTHLATMRSGAPQRAGQVHVEVIDSDLSTVTIQIGSEMLGFVDLLDGDTDRTRTTAVRPAVAGVAD